METTTQKNETLSNQSSFSYEDSGEKLVRIPKDEALVMKKNFLDHTKNFLKLNFQETYKLSLENLEDMLWVEEESDENYDQYDVIRIHFTYYKNEFEGRYSEIRAYDNSLCLLYSRAKTNQENQSFHAIYSINSQIEIEKNDVAQIKNRFKNLFLEENGYMEIKPEYTCYVGIPRMDLLAYYGRILLYNKNNNSNKIIYINICLAGAIAKSDLQAIIENKTKIGSINDIKELKKLVNKNYKPNQLTIIFDAETEKGNLVENISYYDMNSLCPNQCP